MSSPHNRSLLPPEIWLQAIVDIHKSCSEKAAKSSETDPLRDLLNLAQTSRDLRDLTRPYLFKRISITAKSANRDRIEGLISFFQSDRSRCGLPKEFIYRGELSQAAEALDAQVALLFVMLGELQIVSFKGIVCSSEILSHLYRLPNLHTCEFQGCRITPRGEKDTSPNLPSSSLPVRRLAIIDTQGSSPDPQSVAALCPFALGPHLSKLRLQGPVAHVVYANIMDGKCPLATLPTLSVLAVSLPTIPQLPAWYKFLNMCPHVVHLHVLGEISGPMLPKPPGTLPHLKSLYGPMLVVRLLVPGSPVREITASVGKGVGEIQASSEEFAPLALSTDVVRRLRIFDIPWTPVYESAIARLFPQIEDLHFKVSNMSSLEDLLSRVKPIVSNCPRLRSFIWQRTGWHEQDLVDQQKTLLDELTAQGSGLQRASFAHESEWVKAADNQWREEECGMSQVRDIRRHFDWIPRS